MGRDSSMEKLYQNEKSLLKTGLFETRNDIILYLLMSIISQTDQPAGAWQLQEQLMDYGVDCSPASVGRHLRSLDYKEHTVRKGNQGRVLTPLGRAVLAETEARLSRAQMRDNVAQSLQVRKYEELIDLIHARKALETEAARLAARNATPEELEQLKSAVLAHRQCVQDNQDPTETALNFHAFVAKMSHNRFLSTLIDMLIFEEKKIEAVFATLETRERGRVYVKEHEEIAEAIIARDSKHAASLMENHVRGLYRTIAHQAVNDEVSGPALG